MFATSKRSYRQARAVIDMVNVGIAVLVMLFAVLSIFKVYKEMFFFPLIFMLGGILNGLTGIRMILEDRKLLGCGVIIVGSFMLGIGIFSIFVFWR